jgi:hypothetical protein
MTKELKFLTREFSPETIARMFKALTGKDATPEEMAEVERILSRAKQPDRREGS